ncbi:MAG: hypothetical protein ACI8T1_003653 [Verrucomicrobiales bacterium]|jgi:hypothetical protein
MMWTSIVCAFFLAALCTLQADEKPLVVRGGLDGKEFSEIGRLYVDDDKLIHFRSDQRLYYFSHMYYIWDTLAKAGAVADGKIIYDKPIRITGNYSKAAYVYNFLEEPAMRGSQVMWIDRIEKLDNLPESEKAFDGESLKGWKASPAWAVKDGVISCSAPLEKLISESSHTDFELSFEYRSTWGISASLLLRANEKGEGIGVSLDHIDEGIVGFPKSAAGASRPFMLFETREKRGVGKDIHYHIQYDGRSNYDDDMERDNLLARCTLGEFLREWDGGFWNIVKIRCAGSDPEITVWINGFPISQFNAKTVTVIDRNPAQVGAIESYTVHPSGRVGFIIHSTQPEGAEFRLREIRIAQVVAD